MLFTRDNILILRTQNVLKVKEWKNKAILLVSDTLAVKGKKYH